jgi:hypothetical protein
VVGRILSPSAFGLCLVFGVTAYAGAEFLTFDTHADQVQAMLAAPRTATTANVVDKSALSRWTSVSGTSGEARELLLAVIRTESPDDNGAIEQAISEAAEASPAWDSEWLALTEARLASGASFQSVLAAFRMSDLTGSHEGPAMIQRAVFGLDHWAQLPAVDRRIVVRDLLASMSDEHVERRYRDLLAAKPGPLRDDVRDALAASGLATPQSLQALGL